MADIVTQLHDSVNEINALFYNYTGILQRDARPAGTSGDQLGNEIPEGGPVDEGGIKEMAASVVASSRRVDELASALPEVELDEAAQLKRIAALQEENDRLERELKEELEKAGKTLARATAAFEAATNHVFVKADAPEAKAAAAEEMDVEP